MITPSRNRLVMAALVAGVLLAQVSVARAAGTPEQTCQKGRYAASAQYSACQQKALAKFFTGFDYARYLAASGKCQRKYTAAWPKLQAKAPGSSCDAARFADNGTTVTDNLTGLQWEKKQNLDSTVNLANPHDADNFYSWTALPAGTTADGNAFTSFLAALNGGGCFVGQCDWRLPTTNELQTILLAPEPCGTSPCIDPVFGPTVLSYYESATAFPTHPTSLWYVSFIDGDLASGGKDGLAYLRAVRGGL